jgi:hypothetical protein
MSACMPCSFAPCRRSKSEASAQCNRPLGVTVTVRWIPLVTAACGTWVARPARTTMAPLGGDGSQVDRKGEAPPRWSRFVGKSPEDSRQPGGKTRVWAISRSAACSQPDAPATCDSTKPVVTAGARSAPLAAGRCVPSVYRRLRVCPVTTAVHGILVARSARQAWPTLMRWGYM